MQRARGILQINDVFVYDKNYLYRTTFGDKLSAGKSTWQYMKVK